MKKGRININITAIFLYSAFIAFSFVIKFNPGKEIGYTFFTFVLFMIKILPCAFILIGLFEVWIKKEKVEKHLGKDASMLSFLWVILLAATTVGGIYVAFPVACSLYKKGANLSVIFAYIGAVGLCRIPMTVFEASFMGVKFSLIRLFVSLPLVIISSIWLGRYLEKRNYTMMECMK